MALRLVSKNTTKLELGEGDWLEVKVDISRREFNQVFSSLNLQRGDTDVENIGIEEAAAFSEVLFDVLVVNWSVLDENNKPVKPTLGNYELLSRESSQAVDSALVEYFNEIIAVSDEDSQKSEEPSV